MSSCQWCKVKGIKLLRKGPGGRCTLCNACGLQYKNGRNIDDARKRCRKDRGEFKAMAIPPPKKKAKPAFIPTDDWLSKLAYAGKPLPPSPLAPSPSFSYIPISTELSLYRLVILPSESKMPVLPSEPPVGPMASFNEDTADAMGWDMHPAYCRSLYSSKFNG